MAWRSVVVFVGIRWGELFRTLSSIDIPEVYDGRKRLGPGRTRQLCLTIKEGSDSKLVPFTVMLRSVTLESIVMVLPTGTVTLELASGSLPPHVVGLLQAPSAPAIGVAGGATFPQATIRVGEPTSETRERFIF